MTRCLNCNAIMKPDEKACFRCGDQVPKQVTGPSMRARFGTLISLAFFGSIALTVASLVLSHYTPPFVACLTGTIVLLFAKRATDQFTRVKQ